MGDRPPESGAAPRADPGRRRSARRRLRGPALLAGAAVVVHGAPSVAVVPGLGRHLAPGLAGVGRPGHVALTFDDGPDPATTPAFLDALDRLGWTATFFLLGSATRTAPGLAAEIVAAGHEVAVHGDVHRSHLLRPPLQVVDDLQRSTDEVARASGAAPRWFRPPYGHLAAASLVGARRARLRPVLWTAWGREWVPGETPRTVAARITSSLRGDDTVLLHDSDRTAPVGTAAVALASLDLLAEGLATAGLTAGPLRDHRMAPPGTG